MTAYRGRFAPSPSGPLHFGSLVAALGSYLDARAQGGAWLMRIEDLDPPRVAPGATEDILRTLEALGLHWDETPVRQSARAGAYEAALAELESKLYPCACTRKEIADSLLAPDGSPVYPGTCRNGLPPGRTARAIRVRVDDAVVSFEDAIQSEIREDLGREAGDFIVKRADGVFAYQLAVVVDDAYQGITHIVRGADLLHSTARQIHLQRLLGLPQPAYAHLPVVIGEDGQKLSKQNLALPVEAKEGSDALWQALRFLGQQPPAELRGADNSELLAWAVAHWRLDAVPRLKAKKL